MSSKSHKQVNRGFEILKRLDDKPGMAIAVSMQFDYVTDKDESNYLAALNLCRKHGRSEDIGEMLHRYLLYCRQHGEFELVQQNFESAIEELRRLDAPIQLSHILTIYGSYLVYNKQYQQGVRLLEESTNLGKKLASPMIAGAHCELGYAKFKLNEWGDAEHYLQKSIEGFKATLLTHFEGKSLGYLSRIAVARKNQHKAAMYLKRSLQIFCESGETSMFIEALIAYADYLKTFGSVSTSIEILKYIADNPFTETRDRGQAEDLLQELKRELPETLFQEAQEKAKVLTLEQIVEDLKPLLA
jgi:tetratricopeptide (TPR) repeat protein